MAGLETLYPSLLILTISDKLLVQWCHGAAGIVTSMSRTPTIVLPEPKQLDQLLNQTGELVWQVGPLVYPLPFKVLDFSES